MLMFLQNFSTIVHSIEISKKLIGTNQSFLSKDFIGLFPIGYKSFGISMFFLCFKRALNFSFIQIFLLAMVTFSFLFSYCFQGFAATCRHGTWEGGGVLDSYRDNDLTLIMARDLSFIPTRLGTCKVRFHVVCSTVFRLLSFQLVVCAKCTLSSSILSTK